MKLRAADDSELWESASSLRENCLIAERTVRLEDIADDSATDSCITGTKSSY